jgi:acylphosphatase
MSEDLAGLHLIIRGIVQGVCFRATTKEKAQSLNLNGWVKNRNDGAVELVAHGPRPLLDELLGWCRRGPPGARVDEIAVTWRPHDGGHNGFRIVR